MSASAEAQMHRNIGALQHELVGVFKYIRISVRRAVGKCNRNARFDYLAVDHGVLGDCPAESSVGTVQAYKFFDGCGNQFGVFSQLLLKLRILREVVANTADHEWRGYHPNDEALS